ncbi:MAG: hypothetical protein IJT44_09805 [Clostridia bacterium]|nr:hypothetical protein [Clostridia bacterium]
MQNITQQTLKNYRHIQAEIEAFDAVAQDCRQRIAQLIEADKLYQQAAEHFTSEPAEAAEHAETVRQTVTAYRAMEQRAAENALHLVQMKARVEDFMLSIPDADLRRAFALRYLKGMTWQEVAAAIGGNTTEDSIRQQVHRYMKKAE